MTFPRLADGVRSYSVVERADGVRYRVHQGVAGSGFPHDAVHFVVERALGEDGGFWGAVAAGAVFGSMEHLDGRRPPQVEERSREAIRARSGRLQRAELMADLVEHIVSERITSAEHVTSVARRVLSTLPEARVDAAKVLAAARAFEETARHWAALAPGDELVVDWPETGHRRRW